MPDQSYAVKAETFEGNIFTLRGGFASQEEAEDHPVQLSLWKRVWVESVDRPPAKSVEPLRDPAPLPYDWITGGADKGGRMHIYLVDANGRKIGVIWGREGEKEATADLILARVNGEIQRSSNG